MLKLLPNTDSITSRRYRRNAMLARASTKSHVWYVSPVGRQPCADNPPIPDILHANPMCWGDLHGVSQLVQFAFEGGECTGVFDAVVDATPLRESAWDCDMFASHLFFDELVQKCFSIEIDGIGYPKHAAFLSRLLTLSPVQHADTLVRQNVLRELHNCEQFRRNLNTVFKTLYALREKLECCPIDDSDAVTRKLQILQCLRNCIDSLANGFENSQSVLQRLHQAGKQMRQGSAYTRLLQLFDLEKNLATVQVQLRLGADGHVRHLHVMSVKENQANPMVPSVPRRLWQRVKAFVQGHRYGQREIVVSLFHSVFSPLVDSVVACLGIVGQVEFYLASMGFHDLAKRHNLDVCLPDIIDVAGPELCEDEQADLTRAGNQQPKRVMQGLFNPLLLHQDCRVVAVDVPVRHYDSVVLVTGPNSGGKTRFLQALGIAQCLGQAGCFIPAKYARLVSAPTMFVSLVDELQPNQSEGRLGTELVRIRKLFDVLEPGSVAIIDELCSGTNPTEGQEIARMVITLLVQLHSQVFISSHFLGLVKELQREQIARRDCIDLAFSEQIAPFHQPDQMNGSVNQDPNTAPSDRHNDVDDLGCKRERSDKHFGERLEFLQVQLDDQNQPTYQFIEGVATTSLAHLLAQRLGVTREDLEQVVREKATRKLWKA